MALSPTLRVTVLRVNLDFNLDFNPDVNPEPVHPDLSLGIGGQS